MSFRPESSSSPIIAQQTEALILPYLIEIWYGSGMGRVKTRAEIEIMVCMTRRSLTTRRAEALTVLGILEQTYPDATCELNFGSVFQLLVATILSAQSTDRRVNGVTPELFARYPTAAELSQADLEEVEDIIHPTGFFRVKAETIIRMSQELMDLYGGEVPCTLEELIVLPGVGRKTANVVLGEGFGVPGITADTHVMRVSRRLGWTAHTDPVGVEKDLCTLFPADTWISLCHVVIWHGRRRCHARRPACGACPVAAMCPSFGEGETDPDKARLLISEPRR